MKVGELQNRLPNLEPNAELFKYDFEYGVYHRIMKVVDFEKREYVLDPSRNGVFIEKDEYIQRYGQQPDKSEIIDGYVI